MAARRVVLNETAYFGAGSRTVLPEEMTRRGYQKALVVTDPDLIRHGVAGMVFNVLENAGIPFDVYDNVSPNPTVANVQMGVKALRASGADCIVAVGGGSPIDTAKGIGIIATNHEFADVGSLEGVAPTRNRAMPVIALPTTAGTGAEVTINYVITDEKAVKKMVCVDPHDIPVLSIVDAELMASMPHSLTAATGMDALTHAIEGYITRGAWDMSDMFELRAIEMIAAHLEAAVRCPTDSTAREGMALAQYIAGMGFSNVGLGIVHSMAHPLGAMYDIAHGEANALLLPVVMAFNAPATGEKYRAVARAMGVQRVDCMDLDDARQAAVDAVRSLAVRIGIPQHLRELGVKEQDLEVLAAAALSDICTSGNPREVTFEEILALYRQAF